VKPELEQKLAKETKTSLPSLPSVQSSPLCARCEQIAQNLPRTIPHHTPRCRDTTVCVLSSDIASVGYDVESHTLTIEFHATGRYRYFSVPPELRDAFVDSVCPGNFFLMQIKGRFAWEKVTE
jgi:hypothetical protein